MFWNKNKIVSNSAAPVISEQGIFNQQNNGESIRLLKQVDKNKKVVAVIVSFVSGCSYDNLFTSVEQKTVEGTQVLVYACQSNSVKQILEGFKNQSKNQIIKQMINYINSVDPDCVDFNWQCSSGYSNRNFAQGKDYVLSFAKMMIDRGHMVMFSDFSLKALINNWDSHLLGPNPFVAVNQFGGNFKLEFQPEKLRDVPCAQLQIIADLAEKGYCNVHAAGGTIVYGIDTKMTQTEDYQLKILTVVTSLNYNHQCEIKEKKGQAGHILLTYKSGGHLLTSMGHWVQLMKIDTTQKALFEVAAREYGEEKAQQMKSQWASLGSQSQKQIYISKNAVQFVKNQAPCTNMNKKTQNKY